MVAAVVQGVVSWLNPQATGEGAVWLARGEPQL